MQFTLLCFENVWQARQMNPNPPCRLPSSELATFPLDAELTAVVAVVVAPAEMLAYGIKFPPAKLGK